MIGGEYNMKDYTNTSVQDLNQNDSGTTGSKGGESNKGYGKNDPQNQNQGERSQTSQDDNSSSPTGTKGGKSEYSQQERGPSQNDSRQG